MAPTIRHFAIVDSSVYVEPIRHGSFRDELGADFQVIRAEEPFELSVWSPPRG